MDYGYDPLNRVSKIKEKGGSSGAPLLAVYGYDELGRRTGLTRGNGTTTGWGWDTADRLTSLAHDPASTAYDQTWGYSYNPASQVIGRTAGNALYDWTNRPAGTVTKSYDGLDRDAGLASLGDGYDLNGNVTHDARQLYAYDIENRLVSVADAGPSLTEREQSEPSAARSLDRYACSCYVPMPLVGSLTSSRQALCGAGVSAQAALAPACGAPTAAAVLCHRYLR